MERMYGVLRGVRDYFNFSGAGPRVPVAQGIMPEEEVLEVSEMISSLSNEQWEFFVLEMLSFSKKRFQTMKRESRLKVMKEWKAKSDIKYVCGHIEPLIEKVKAEVSLLAITISNYDGAPEGKNREMPFRPLQQTEERACKGPRSKGCALIIVNSFRYAPKPTRGRKIERSRAAAKDVELMEHLWKDVLGCDLFDDRVHVNKTAAQMQQLLHNMSMLKEEYGYVVVAISTHGAMCPDEVVKEHEVKDDSEIESKWPLEGIEGAQRTAAICNQNLENFQKSMKKAKEDGKGSTVEVFFGDDCKPVREREVKKYFYNNRPGSGLHNIPKFFILDYCRGSGKKSLTEMAVPIDYEPPSAGKDMTSDEEEGEVTSLLPAVSDVLVAYATHPDFAAYDRPQGSWLISAIAEIFKNHYKEEHAVSMLTLVNEKIKSLIIRESENSSAFHGDANEIGEKAMSVFESSLASPLYF